MKNNMMKKHIWLAATLAASAFAAQAELNLDEVLAEYVDARGGMAAINSMKSMKATGKMTMGPMEVPLSFVYKAPDKIYTTFEMQGMKGIQAFDGEKGWQVMPFLGKSEAELVAGDDLKQLQEQADIEGVLVNSAAKGIALELVGLTELEGTPVIEIKATRKSGDVVTVFLDEEYKLEVMTRNKMTSMGQEIEAETYFSDYKEVGPAGMPIAHAMAVKINGMVAQNMTFESVEFNQDVSDDLFKMPVAADTKEAVEVTE